MDFEAYVMPRLANEYMQAGKKKVLFDLQKIRDLGKEDKAKGEGFAIETWDQTDLQDDVNILVSKGLIEDLGDGKYQISNLGIERYVVE